MLAIFSKGWDNGMRYELKPDGTGDFPTLQDAVDALPDEPREPVTILLRAGVYRGRVLINKNRVRLVGENAEQTILTHSACAKDPDENGQERGTFLSYTLMITGSDVTVENLTVRNDAGDGRDVGQAVAVYAAGDCVAFYGVRMLAHQDTLFCGPVDEKVRRDALPRAIDESLVVEFLWDCPSVKNRLYFEDCEIRGDVDFIFGPYICWFERCTLWMNERGGYYTAANTPERAPYGFVFHECRLTGDCAPGAAYLGRPWRAYARTVFLCCDMDEHVHPQGFTDWNSPVTQRYGEYGTRGARSEQTARHPNAKRLTRQEAAEITPLRVLNGWLPSEQSRSSKEE